MAQLGMVLVVTMMLGQRGRYCRAEPAAAVAPLHDGTFVLLPGDL
jgi:hypothetical protein